MGRVGRSESVEVDLSLGAWFDYYGARGVRGYAFTVATDISLDRVRSGVLGPLGEGSLLSGRAVSEGGKGVLV